MDNKDKKILKDRLLDKWFGSLWRNCMFWARRVNTPKKYTIL